MARCPGRDCAVTGPGHPVNTKEMKAAIGMHLAAEEAVDLWRDSEGDRDPSELMRGISTALRPENRREGATARMEREAMRILRGMAAQEILETAVPAPMRAAAAAEQALADGGNGRHLTYLRRRQHLLEQEAREDGGLLAWCVAWALQSAIEERISGEAHHLLQSHLPTPEFSGYTSPEAEGAILDAAKKGYLSALASTQKSREDWGEELRRDFERAVLAEVISWASLELLVVRKARLLRGLPGLPAPETEDGQ